MKILLSGKGRVLQVSVSTAKPVDAGIVSELVVSIFPRSGISEARASALIIGGDVFWLVRREKAAVGFLHFKKKKTYYFIKGIGVVPSLEGLGLGSGLIEACARRALKNGVSILRLVVSAANYRATNFYEKNGFRIIKTSSEENSPVYVLEKNTEN